MFFFSLVIHPIYWVLFNSFYICFKCTFILANNNQNSKSINMETFEFIFSLVIGLPVVLLITYFIGAIARAVIFKEQEYKYKNVGNILINILIGVGVVFFFTTLFKGCNQDSDSWIRQ